MATTVHLSSPTPLFKSNNLHLSSSSSISQLPFHSNLPSKRSPTTLVVTSSSASHTNSSSPYYPIRRTQEGSHEERTKTKIVCTIGPSTSSPHMISKLAETGMNVARLNMSRGDLGAELPIEEVPLLQEDIIRRCNKMQKPVIVATNMLESMIIHPTPIRAEVSDIEIAVRQGVDAVMLSGETAHGKYPLKSVKVMRAVALRNESSVFRSDAYPNHLSFHKSHMGEMFAFHATTMSITSSPDPSKVVERIQNISLDSESRTVVALVKHFASSAQWW